MLGRIQMVSNGGCLLPSRSRIPVDQQLRHLGVQGLALQRVDGFVDSETGECVAEPHWHAFFEQPMLSKLCDDRQGLPGRELQVGCRARKQYLVQTVGHCCKLGHLLSGRVERGHARRDQVANDRRCSDLRAQSDLPHNFLGEERYAAGLLHDLIALCSAESLSPRAVHDQFGHRSTIQLLERDLVRLAFEGELFTRRQEHQRGARLWPF